jgi:hypothetical protein
VSSETRIQPQGGAVAPQSILNAISAAQQASYNVTTAVGKTIFQASLSNSIADPLNQVLDGLRARALSVCDRDRRGPHISCKITRRCCDYVTASRDVLCIPLSRLADDVVIGE